jgi:hypothetical protein
MKVATCPHAIVDGRLGAKGTVGCVHCLGEPEVDLELTAGEFVVGRDHLQSLIAELAQSA